MKKQHDSNQFRLQVEELEQRMMLSTVSLQATGQEGSEILNVYVGEELVVEATVPTSGQNYEVSLDREFSAIDVRIEFVNDLYQPEIGFDRNITIDSFSVDGQSLDFNNSDMFSNATWLPTDGVTDGYGRGNTLHANGFFSVSGREQSVGLFSG